MTAAMQLGLGALERLWKRVDRTPTCWLWTGYKSRAGYGYIYTKAGRREVHRVAYEALVGPIPAGLELDHLCCVRNCVRPDHLEPVTHRENLMRAKSGIAWLNSIKTECPQGHPYTAENTRIWREQRRCRQCDREAKRRQRALTVQP